MRGKPDKLGFIVPGSVLERVVGDVQEIQEVGLSTFRKRGGFRGITSEDVGLYETATRFFIKHLKGESRRLSAEIEEHGREND